MISTQILLIFIKIEIVKSIPLFVFYGADELAPGGAHLYLYKNTKTKTLPTLKVAYR